MVPEIIFDSIEQIESIVQNHVQSLVGAHHILHVGGRGVDIRHVN